MAYKIKDEQNVEGLVRKDSVEIKVGDVIAFDGSVVRPATTGDTKIAGLSMQDVRTTDTDFATAGKEILVDMYEFENSAEFEVSAGTPGLYKTYDVDAADASKLSCSATGAQWFVMEVITIPGTTPSYKVIAKLAKRFV